VSFFIETDCRVWEVTELPAEPGSKPGRKRWKTTIELVSGKPPSMKEGKRLARAIIRELKRRGGKNVTIRLYPTKPTDDQAAP
jgi:hypothetical protein